MLKHIDFVPQQLAEPKLFSAGQHQSFEAAVKAANDWLENQDIELVQLETVVLPNIWSRWEDGTGDASIQTSGENTSRWHQFLRVWYRDKK